VKVSCAQGWQGAGGLVQLLQLQQLLQNTPGLLPAQGGGLPNLGNLLLPGLAGANMQQAQPPPPQQQQQPLLPQACEPHMQPPPQQEPLNLETAAEADSGATASSGSEAKVVDSSPDGQSPESTKLVAEYRCHA
jgi:hypothetical protein